MKLICKSSLALVLIANLFPASAMAFWGFGKSDEQKSWPCSEAKKFDSIGAEVACHPDVQIPESSSISEACEIYFAMDALHTHAEDTYKPLILKEARRVGYGEITEAEYYEITEVWENKTRKADRRWLASAVGVLRQAGDQGWKKYSRYKLSGVGDLWRSQILKGDKVADNPSHPDYQYTYRSLWYGEPARICKRYK